MTIGEPRHGQVQQEGRNQCRTQEFGAGCQADDHSRGVADCQTMKQRNLISAVPQRAGEKEQEHEFFSKAGPGLEQQQRDQIKIQSPANGVTQ